MLTNKFITYVKQINIFASCYCTLNFPYRIPFINLYEKSTGQTISNDFVMILNKKYPAVIKLSEEHIQNTLRTISRFSITADQACLDPHIFCMNPICMENYGEILRECCFTSILPIHIIRYHTLVKSRTITRLKEDGLLRYDLNLEQTLHECFQDWPQKDIMLSNYPDNSTNIVTIRMSVLEKYLKWKLGITSDQFRKYCKNYLPLRHRPMCDIQEALNIAQNIIKFDVETIRRNGFIISADPVNTKLILENVKSLGGLDIQDAIKIEPAILKNNYQSLLQIKTILEEFNVSDEAQRYSLKVYCMRPHTVRERLEHISRLKEYEFLSTNTRMLYMVVHEKKMMNRLTKIQETKKQCFSLNHLVSSNKVFNAYLNNFGDKICSKDMGLLISSSLKGENINTTTVLNKLRKHKYWLHTALNVISDNLQMLKSHFDDAVIFDNCQILLYPIHELKQYIYALNKARKGHTLNNDGYVILDASYNNLNLNKITDSQLLSLVLYEIEKKYHFSGDGVWNKQDGSRMDVQEKRLKQNM